MAAQGRNKGFHVLEEFVCEAIHAPSVPLANPANQGKNEGMSVVEELVFEAGLEATADETVGPDRHRSSPPHGPDAALKSVIEPLAAYISASSNPRGALASAMELLLAELTGMDQAAAEVLESLRPAGHTSESRGNKPAGPGTAPDPAGR
jgi:hypothetical protein